MSLTYRFLFHFRPRYDELCGQKEAIMELGPTQIYTANGYRAGILPTIGSNWRTRSKLYEESYYSDIATNLYYQFRLPIYTDQWLHDYQFTVVTNCSTCQGQRSSRIGKGIIGYQGNGTNYITRVQYYNPGPAKAYWQRIATTQDGWGGQKVISNVYPWSSKGMQTSQGG